MNTLPGAGAHILVVDDEPDLCWALEAILRRAGYRVTTVTRATEALTLLETETVAAAFLDAKLPDLDGIELAGLLRQHSPSTGIILISGYYYKEDKAIIEALQQGLFLGFIAKPFDLAEVRRLARLTAQRDGHHEQ